MNHPSQDDPPPDLLEPVVEALANGAPTGDQERLIATAAAAMADREPSLARGWVREAALRALIAEPGLRETLAAFEEWLDGAPGVESAIPLASGWALSAAGLDLDTAAREARLYIDAYPIEGRVIGDLDARAARWLAARLGQVQAKPADRLPAVRRSIRALAEAAENEFPQAAASLRGVANEVSDDQLWYELALRITQRQLAFPTERHGTIRN